MGERHFGQGSGFRKRPDPLPFVLCCGCRVRVVRTSRHPRWPKNLRDNSATTAVLDWRGFCPSRGGCASDIRRHELNVV